MRQLDLFQDSPRTIALNVLREALLARNAPGARVALERLLNLDPGHETAGDAGMLIAVLEASAPEGPGEGIEWLHALEREWRPTRGPSIRPSRTPRELGLPAGAGLGNVNRSVLEVPEHETTPVLLTRLAEAEYRLGDRIRAGRFRLP